MVAWEIAALSIEGTAPTAVSKLTQFRSPHISLCLSEETLKASGPLYLVVFNIYFNEI